MKLIKIVSSILVALLLAPLAALHAAEAMASASASACVLTEQKLYSPRGKARYGNPYLLGGESPQRCGGYGKIEGAI